MVGRVYCLDITARLLNAKNVEVGKWSLTSPDGRMTDIRELIKELRDPMLCAFVNDPIETADTMERLLAVYETAKDVGQYDDYFVHESAEIAAWKRMSDAIAAVQNRET